MSPAPRSGPSTQDDGPGRRPVSRLIMVEAEGERKRPLAVRLCEATVAGRDRNRVELGPASGAAGYDESDGEGERTVRLEPAAVDLHEHGPLVAEVLVGAGAAGD